MCVYVCVYVCHVCACVTSLGHALHVLQSLAISPKSESAYCTYHCNVLGPPKPYTLNPNPPTPYTLDPRP